VKEVNVKKDTRHASHIAMFDREVLRKKYQGNKNFKGKRPIDIGRMHI
jgi:hypothetical protein